MDDKREPLGRAYIHSGWRTIYTVRTIKRGKSKGLFEVSYIDLKNGMATYVKTKVSEYRNLEGEIIYGKKGNHGVT